MPYHVRITPKSDRSYDEVKLDLTKEQLEERFLIPYREGRSIVIGGRTIPPDDIERIRITYTDETSEQLLPVVRAEHQANDIISVISDEWYVADHGRDVTDDLITGPPGTEVIQRGENRRVTTPVLPPIITTKYLDIERFPHDFYKDLAEQINACYRYRLYPAAQILIRKLLENCLIDILRKRYGMNNVKLFYNINDGHFNDFSTLLENASRNINDLAYVKDSFNEDLIRRINNFREQGNSSAHNINLDIRTVMSELDQSRNELNFIVKSLFRTIDNLKG